MRKRYVLDTSLLLGGQEPPRDGVTATTPEAANEVSPGGRDHRRFEGWLAAGLQIQSAPPETLDRVQETALAAGNLARLSAADLSLLALALEQGSTLVTDDHTMLDVALRMGITTQTVNTTGIARPLDFRPRCIGCGRWYEAPPPRDECTVCGSPVKPKPTRPRDPAPRGGPQR